MHERSSHWDDVAKRQKPSWYLDTLVAEQKRAANQGLIRKWTGDSDIRTILKTDLFEEAFGEDQILFDLFPKADRVLGIDIAEATVHGAKSRSPLPNSLFLATDVRKLALREDLVDLVVSTSTLDHFDCEADFDAALGELARTLKPGGILIVTLDNIQNPLYPILRWMSHRGHAPFRMGYTTSTAGLVRKLKQTGLDVCNTGVLIHNPRLLSTVLFLCLRRILGVRADFAIRGLLKLFSMLEHLPSRRFTACFVAACACKPVGTDTVQA